MSDRPIPKEAPTEGPTEPRDQSGTPQPRPRLVKEDGTPLTPEDLLQMAEFMKAIDEHGDSTTALIMGVAKMQTLAWRAGKAGKHPDIAILTDALQNVVSNMLLRGSLNMCEFIMTTMKEAPDKPIGPIEVYTAYKFCLDEVNRTTDYINNMLPYIYTRDEPSPCPTVSTEDLQNFLRRRATGSAGSTANTADSPAHSANSTGEKPAPQS